jgi:cephalosporin hydroxylase
MRNLARLFLLAPLVLAFGCSRDRKPASDDIASSFNRYYLEGPGAAKRIFGGKYLGVPLIQTPTDLWAFQELLTEIQPDFVIETGTYKGGTTLYFATLLDQLNPESKVITIDIEPQFAKPIEALAPALRQRVNALWQRRVEFIQSNSVDPKLIESLAARVKGKTVLVTLDSCHNVGHVLRELQLYAPLVSKGSYLVVQDTRHDDDPEWVKRWATCSGYDRVGGPGLAVDEFLRSNSDFKVDRERERFLLTWYPRGYLKRVR